MSDKLLPIGTIVKLKQPDTICMMIIGYYPIDEEAGQMYEYLTVLYPQGILSKESLFLMDLSEIKEVVFRGYADEESEVLCEIIPQALQEIALEE